MNKNQEYIKGSIALTRLGSSLERGNQRPPPPDHTPDHTDETGEGAGFSSPQSIGMTPMHAHELPGKAEQTVIFNPTANLPILKANLLNLTGECNPRFIITECCCGRKVFPQSCMKLSCTTCAPYIGLRRARAVFYRLVRENILDFGGRIQGNVIYTVFTIPPRLRMKFTDTHKLRLLRSKLWQLLEKKFGALFAVEATHPISEKSPEVFHPHLNYLWKQRPGFRSYINIENLRKEFAKILHYSGEPNCWTHYSNVIGKIWHWSKYVTRVFSNVSAWAGPVKWYGDYPRYKVESNFQCAECGETFKLLGYIDRYAIQDYEERGWRMGVDPPWYNDERIQFFKRRKTLE